MRASGVHTEKVEIFELTPEAKGRGLYWLLNNPARYVMQQIRWEEYEILSLARGDPSGTSPHSVLRQSNDSRQEKGLHAGLIR